MKKVRKVKKNANYERLTRTGMDPKSVMFSEVKRPRKKSTKRRK